MSILSMFRNTRLVMGLAGILMWLAASSRGGAQDIPTYRLDTGFFTFTAGEQVRISVAELGTSTVGKVRVSILDEAERAIVPPRTLAFRRGAPAKFDLTLSSVPIRRLRFQLVFLNATRNTPIVTGEGFNPALDLVGTRFICLPPDPKQTPVTQASCPGGAITDLTTR